MARAWAVLYAYLLRPVAVYFAALATVRLMGKRALGQLSLFDLVIMVGIGEIVVLVGLERKVSLLDGLLMLGLLGGLEVFLSALAFRWRWFARLLEGEPTVLVHEGRLLRPNLRREHISLRDLRQELRKKGLEDYQEAKEVVLEACGKISVIPREEVAENLADIRAELGRIREELSRLVRQEGGAPEANTRSEE
ncbi:MAG: DUF421 domain-containing protein [Firmicutes bacterium]|nr:DUF421 domain-containing protein [Bacillota bacterium]